MPDLLTFQPWSDALVDAYDLAPDSTVSRLCWLPIIGPTSWLLWGTIATQLRTNSDATWELGALAEAHGIARSAAANGALRRTLMRLTQFNLACSCRGDRYLVRLTAPPLTRRQLGRLPDYAVAVHDAAYRMAYVATG